MSIDNLVMKALVFVNIFLVATCMYLFSQVSHLNQQGHTLAENFDPVLVKVETLQKNFDDLAKKFEQKIETEVTGRNIKETFLVGEVIPAELSVNDEAADEEAKANAERTKQYEQEAELYRSIISKTDALTGPSVNSAKPTPEKKPSNDTEQTQ